MTHPRTSLGLIVFALAQLCACTLDFDELGTSRRDAGARDAAPGGSDGGGDDDGGDDDGGGLDGSTPDDGQVPLDGGSDADVPAPVEPICDPGALRCAKNLVQRCSTAGDKWNEQQDCAAKSCNPVTLACHACEAPVTSASVLECAALRAEASGDAAASVATTGAGNDAQGSCGGSGAPERVVEWLAPSTDYFTFDTRGSAFDTVLYARDCACDGAELACNDDAASGGTNASDFVLHATKGQRVAVFVDGKLSGSGDAVLNVHPVTCPSLDLDPAQLPATFVDDGGDGSEAFRFTPAATGLYSMRAFVPAGGKLCLQQGPRCAGAEIACNTSDSDYGAEVLRVLPAGEPVTLVLTMVQSGASFDLDVQEISGASCEDPNAFDSMGVAHVGTGANAKHYLSSSCHAAGGIDISLNPRSFPEVRFGYDYGGNGAGCGINIAADFFAVAYLLRDDCSGVEVDCAVSTYDSASSSYKVKVGPPPSSSPAHYVVVVENASSNYGADPSFTAYVSCVL